MYLRKVKKKKDDNSYEFEESEIDLIILENGILYPIEIKKNSNPTTNDALAFTILDKDISKKEAFARLFVPININ